MPVFTGQFLIETAEQYVGQELVVSDWVTITQDQVTTFGEITNHLHWMHLDAERAARESPYGGTLVQGFLMSSLLVQFNDMTELRPADSAYALNYGFDRVRYLAPVVTGNGVRLRDRISLLSVEDKGDGRKLMKTSHVLEVEVSDEPALYAEWLALWVPKDID
jgi:acyl dehydratase